MDNLKIENNLMIKENININILQKLKLDISKNTCIMNAKDLHYKDLNFAIREIVKLIKEIRNSKTDEFYNLKHFLITVNHWRLKLSLYWLKNFE